MKTLNDKKICFIICSNNEQYLNECILYLNLLIVPDEMETQLLVVADATSMTSGYNEAMNSSDAKYKVYLHQDTFIINPNFIQDLVDVFKSDEKIGVVGMIGAPKLAIDGVMWHDERCGNFYNLDKLLSDGVERLEKVTEGIVEVDVVDGLLIATQYDLPWREDILHGWDFYDVSQCLEYKRAGYKVVVPGQKESWTNHRCGAPSFWKYEDNRKIIMKEYPEIYQGNGGKRILFVPSDKISIKGLAVGLALEGKNVEIWNKRTPLGGVDEQVVEQLEEFLEIGHYELVVTFDFCVSVAIACQNMKVKYFAWIYDSPQFELYTKQAKYDTNYIMVFDRKQYERMQELNLHHLYYGPLATDVEEFGSIVLSDEDEKKYSCDVSFVGRLYNKLRFEELFTKDDDDCLKEANNIFETCKCKWDGKTTIYGHASEKLIDKILERESVSDWDDYCLDKRFYVESFKLARKLNEIERVSVLNRISLRHQVRLYTDDSKLQGLKNVDIRQPLEYMDEMPKAFYFSKINLNISSRSIEMGIPQRVLDIMAVGGFVLSNYQSELEEYFEIGKDLDVFHDLDELERKIDYYLKHEKDRLQIAMNGYKKVRKYFSYTVRAGEMVNRIIRE